MRRSGAPTARKFWLGARAFLLVVLIAGLAIVLPESTEATSRHQLKKLTAADLAPSAVFGSGVAVSGDTVTAWAAAGEAGGAGRRDKVGQHRVPVDGLRRRRFVGPPS